MRRLRRATGLPLWAKLTPNTGDIAEVARAAEANGADAVVVANTILAHGDRHGELPPAPRQCHRRAIRPGGEADHSAPGLPMRPRRQAPDIIGCGGISRAEDAVEYLLAGARAVQVGTATFLHATAMIDVIDGLAALLRAARDRAGRRSHRRLEQRGRRQERYRLGGGSMNIDRPTAACVGDLRAEGAGAAPLRRAAPGHERPRRRHAAKATDRASKGDATSSRSAAEELASPLRTPPPISS